MNEVLYAVNLRSISFLRVPKFQVKSLSLLATSVRLSFPPRHLLTGVSSDITHLLQYTSGGALLDGFVDFCTHLNLILPHVGHSCTLKISLRLLLYV